MSMRKHLSNLVRIYRKDGVRAAADAVFRFVLGAVLPMQTAPSQKTKMISHYKRILGEPHGYGLCLSLDNVPAGSMSWVMPDFTASSGGHINIFRMMRLLNERGFADQRAVIMEPHRWKDQAEAQVALNQSFGDHGIEVSLGVESLEPSHFVVATSWQTAYWVDKYKDVINKLYFVQDFEPYFYAHSTDYFLAENTYKLNLTALTAGPWLAKKLSEDYGMRTFPFSFSYDKDLYQPLPRKEKQTRHVFFYARPVTPRRCFELGLLALEEVCKRHADVVVLFAGWDISDYEIEFKHINCGSVSTVDLPELYSQCDVALVLSGTNLSLLPMELTACGCPVVMNRSENSNWLLSEEEAFYCDMEVGSIAEAVNTVLVSPDLAADRAAAAMERALSGSWEAEADKVADFLKTL